MAREGQSMDDMIKERDAFVDQRLDAARNWLQTDASGVTTLRLLGEALHAIMDSTSPAHIANGHCRVWKPWRHPILASQHSPDDFFPIGEERTKNMTPDIYRVEDQLIYAAYLRVFGP